MLAQALATAEVNPNPATRPKLILPKIEKRSLSLRMSWPELLTVMRRVRDLGLQPELAVVAFVAAPTCAARSSRGRRPTSTCSASAS